MLGDLQEGGKRLVLLSVTHAETPAKFMEKAFPEYGFTLENSQFLQIEPTEQGNNTKLAVTLYPQGLSQEKKTTEVTLDPVAEI